MPQVVQVAQPEVRAHDPNAPVLTMISGAVVLAAGVAIAQQVTVDINRISDAGVGDKIGAVVISEGKGGVSFKVAVTGLPKGQRGFHVHEKGDCGPG